MSASVVALVVSAMLLAAAPLWMPRGFDWRRHTISDSAAQDLPRAWLARVGLALLGVASVRLAIDAAPLGPATRIGLALFGLGMISSGAWSKRPWQHTASFDQRADRIHSLSARIAGMGYMVATLAHLSDRWAVADAHLAITVAALVTALVCPAITFRVPQVGGGAQRVMFGVSYLWIGSLAVR